MPEDQWSKAVSYGSMYGVPPEFLASIAQHETAFGRLGWGRENQGSYVLGYGAYSDTTADPKYSGIDNQYKYAARQIGDFFSGKPYNAQNIQEFARRSWQPGDPDSWAASISKIFAGLTGGGDIIAPPPADQAGETKVNLSVSDLSPKNMLVLGAVVAGTLAALVLIFGAGLSGVNNSG